ncbi:MAG: hypothetical protein R6T87_00720, partial [Marinobacter sp.]
QDIMVNGFRTDNASVCGLNLTVNDTVCHAIQHTRTQMLLKRGAIRCPVKLIGDKLDEPLQTAVHLQGSWLLEEAHHPFVIGVGRGINSGCEWIKVDHQNVILVITRVIVAGLSRHYAGSPGIQVSPGSVNTELGFSPHPDHDLVVFMPMLMSGDRKFQEFRVEH